MAGDRLGKSQREVLRALTRFDAGLPPTAGEMADFIARTERRHIDVGACLRRMASKGWVERTGSAFNGAWCYRITEAGRTALEEAMSGTTTGDDSE